MSKRQMEFISIQRKRPKQSAAGKRRLKKRRRKRRNLRILILTVFGMILFAVIFLLIKLFGNFSQENPVMNVQKEKARIETYDKNRPEWTTDLLTPNPNSRPETELKKVKNIFVHYTANPGTNAVQNRSYFEQLKDTKERFASAHFIIGYEGDIVQCVPLEEIAYAVKSRNEDSLSIECCYKEEDGSFTQETYDSLIKLLVWLVGRYDLEAEDILRHYDCGGKKCPLYYTENEDEWIKLKEAVAKKLKKDGIL